MRGAGQCGRSKCGYAGRDARQQRLGFEAARARGTRRSEGECAGGAGVRKTQGVGVVNRSPANGRTDFDDRKDSGKRGTVTRPDAAREQEYVQGWQGTCL